jgi:hypothetical protein
VDTPEEKQSDLCRKLARQLREIATLPTLKSRHDDILRQADEWDRLAKLAEENERS